MSICLQIHEEENVDEMQDMSNNIRWAANQVKFCWHLCCHSCSLFLSCVYDTSSLIWSETYSIWYHQHLCACKSGWNHFHENVRQILKDWSYTEAQQDFIQIVKIFTLMTAEAEKDSVTSKI